MTLSLITIALIGLGALGGLSIFLVFLGLSLRGQGDLSERMDRYAVSITSGIGASSPIAPREERISLGTILSKLPIMNRLNSAVEQQSFGANLTLDLARASLTIRSTEWLAIWAAVTIGTPFVMLLLSLFVPTLGTPIALIVGTFIGFRAPKFYLGFRKGRRLKRINKQLPDAITLLANSLRAGSSFLQAIEMLVRQSKPPISEEFARVIREVNLGLSLEVALKNMVRRVRSDDLELMATAVSIQYQVGGNLAEILEAIAGTIRERVRLKGMIAALTSQQKMSGYVVAFLPIGVGGFLFVIAPQFMAPMFTAPPAIAGIPAGEVVLGIAGFVMFLGFMAIRKVVDIKV
jgi:tight adherence protein B